MIQFQKLRLWCTQKFDKLDMNPFCCKSLSLVVLFLSKHYFTFALMVYISQL